MSTTALISVEEYVATSYRPDRDFIDGELQERNLGELEHSLLQGSDLRLVLDEQERMERFSPGGAASPGCANSFPNSRCDRPARRSTRAAIITAPPLILIEVSVEGR